MVSLVSALVFYGVFNAARQRGSAFGVAIFGALMSVALLQANGIQAAIYTAIALTLSAAVGWRLAFTVASRPQAPDGKMD